MELPWTAPNLRLNAGCVARHGEGPQLEAEPPKAAAVLTSIRESGKFYPRQAEARITPQKLPRRKDGSLSARTSAFTLPKVVSGLCLIPS